MGLFILILLFVGLPIGGDFLLTWLFDIITGYEPTKTYKYIDRSTHHHYHDNRQLTIDGNKFTPNSDKSTIDTDS